MNEKDKSAIITRYDKRFEQYGDDIRAIASGSMEKEQIRFEVLSSIGNLDGASLLDLGCGLGYFYDFITEKGWNVEYTGYDINPKFIDYLRKKYPEVNFELKDIQADPTDRTFDYIISSQAFNNKLQYGDNDDIIKDIIKRCFDLCNIGIAIDMMTDYVDFKEDHLHYYNPEKIFKFCKSLSKRVTLRHDYPLYEFTIYLYKKKSSKLGI